MTTTNTVLIESKHAENAQTAQYTVAVPLTGSSRVVIDSFTVTNTSGADANFSCDLVTLGGSASASNLVLNARAIAPGETYTCPELVGQVLAGGSFISTLASVASALVIRASGREITIA